MHDKPNCCGNIVVWTTHRPSMTYVPQRQCSGWDIQTNFQVQPMLDNGASRQTHLVASDASAVREVVALRSPILLGIDGCWEDLRGTPYIERWDPPIFWDHLPTQKRIAAAACQCICIQSLPLRKGCCGPLRLAKRRRSVLCNFG